MSVAYATNFIRTLDKWKGDIPDLTDDDWENCIVPHVSNMISARDGFIQLKFLHRAYNTLQRPAAIYPLVIPFCTRCYSSTGTIRYVKVSCVAPKASLVIL